MSDPHARFPLAVRERLKVSDETGRRNAAAVNASFPVGFLEDLNRRMEALIKSPEPVWVRLRALYAFSDEFNSYTVGHTPCRRGCAHCCHIAVAVLEPEAQMLGATLQRQPCDVAVRWSPGDAAWGADFDYGYHRPCTF